MRRISEREKIARIIDPSTWAVMDSYLAEVRRKYRGDDAGYDPDAFKDKTSLAKADAILALRAEGAALRPAPKQGEVKRIGRLIYEANPCGDQETDLDGRPTGPGYVIGWDDLLEYDAGIYDGIMETARKIAGANASAAMNKADWIAGYTAAYTRGIPVLRAGRAEHIRKIAEEDWAALSTPDQSADEGREG